MKKVILGWLFALMVASLATEAAAQESGWLTSYPEAQKAAKEKNLPIMADFTGSDWCGWCKKLKAEVFDKDEFKKWAQSKVILLELDFPKSLPQSDELKAQNKDLQKKFKITGYPTIVFMDAEGQKIGTTGYVAGGPEKWIAKADAALATPKKEAVKEDAKPGEGWIESYADAIARAKKEKKLILADFTGSDWCGWCKKLKGEVFDKEEFQAWAKKNVILLEVDFPQQKKQSDELKQQNEKLQKEHKIEGYPTILFLDASGKEKGRMGYEAGGPKNWVEKAQKIVDKANR